MEQIDKAIIKDLRDKYGTPFYVMSASRYRSNLRSFLSAFTVGYDKVIAGYSFKTNYVPALCQIAKEEGCYAEVVSEMEFELAEKLGFKHIIFNGPIKTQRVIDKAIACNAIINLDSEYEVDYICQYRNEHPEKPLSVGLRLNVQLQDSCGRSTVQCGLRHGRFGFPHDILGKTIERLLKSGVTINSVHGHTSSSDRAVLNYKIITEYMLSVCEEFGLNDVEYFDIGGGFFGAAPEGLDVSAKPSYDDYAQMVLSLVVENEWFKRVKPFIVIEPGSSVVSNVFDYYTSVYQLKTIDSKHFVIVDGTVFDVKPTMHTSNLPFSVISPIESTEIRCKDSNIICDVVGSTCMEKDIILRDVELSHLKKGDMIQIRGVGSYTISLSPTFINFLAPIFSLEDNEVRVLRRRQSIEDVLKIYKL